MSAATFKVQDVIHITGRTETYILGRIGDGEIRAGMRAKVLIDGGLFMFAKILRIEFVRDVKRRSDVALTIETPEEEVGRLWKELCRAGDILVIDPGKKA